MADTDPIKIEVRVEGLAEAKAGLEGVGKTAGQMGDDTQKAGAAGKLGLWGLGEAAEKAASSIGIPNAAARKLGGTVEDLVGKFGKYAAVVGGVGLAVAAGVAIWNKYRDSQEKARQETLKAADASMTWIEAARVETKETANLKNIKDELFQVEKERNILKLEQGIRAQTEEIIRQHEELEKSAKLAAGEGGTWARGGSLFERWIYGTPEELDLAYKNASLNAREGILKLKKMREDLAIAEGKAGGIRRKTPEDKTEREAPTIVNQYEREAAYQAQLLDLYRATGASKEEIWAQELAAFDWATSAKMANARSEQEYYDTLALREMERNEMLAKDEEARQKRRVGGARQMFDDIKGYYKMMADQRGSSESSAWRRYKQLAVSEAYVSAGVAAVKAYKALADIPYVGPALGAAAAAAALAFGHAQAEGIKRQEPGSSGGGGGGYPSFNANPTTGLPTSGGSGGGMNLTLIINGREERIGEITEGVVKEIDRRNGSVAGIKLVYTRSA